MRDSGGTITRREALRLALATPLLALGASTRRARGGRAGGLDLQSLAQAPSRVVSMGDPRGLDKVRLTRSWDGPLCRSHLVNAGRDRVRVKEAVLFDLAHRLPRETALYGEGFQMLTQTGGDLGQPLDLGDYTDSKHYKIPQPADARSLYSLMTLAPPGAGHLLLAFTSCRRFSGRFDIRDGSFQIVLDLEGLELRPGQEWELEEFTFRSGPDREDLLAGLAERLRENHFPPPWGAPPSGWCSWYCFGPRVTSQDILANLDAISRDLRGLRYIQIDDGYQPAMGDWLETGPAFGGKVQGVLAEIRRRGFEPAIWAAPFVAEKDSRVFQQHPDWFVRDAGGGPLRTDKVTFGGWRRGPWFVLDGTHPGVQSHLEAVFRTMRTAWGCSYFKLDANFWGAIHGGLFHDPHATRIEAYRRGMEAIRRGAGDAFLLGCNHPLWPSLGLIHGSRSSNDIKRSWTRVAGTARQNLSRNWQNGRVWWNDPDAVVLTGDLSDDEFRFHATSIYATGGMLLSGDDLTKISPARKDMLRRLQPPTGVPARFAERSLRVGTVELKDRRVVCLLNWDDTPQTFSFTLPGRQRIRDFWTDEDLGLHAGAFSRDLPAHGGCLLVCRPEA